MLILNHILQTNYLKIFGNREARIHLRMEQNLGVFFVYRGLLTGLKRICKARMQNRLNVPCGFLTLVTTLNQTR